MPNKDQIEKYLHGYTNLLKLVDRELISVNARLFGLMSQPKLVANTREKILENAKLGYNDLKKDLELYIKIANDTIKQINKRTFSPIRDFSNHLRDPNELKEQFLAIQNNLNQEFLAIQKPRLPRQSNQQSVKTISTPAKNMKIQQQLRESAVARESQPKPELRAYKTKDIEDLRDLASAYVDGINIKIGKDATAKQRLELEPLAKEMNKFINQCVGAIKKVKKFGFLKKENTGFDMNLITSFYDKLLPEAKKLGIKITKSSAEPVRPVPSKSQKGESTRENKSRSLLTKAKNIVNAGLEPLAKRITVYRDDSEIKRIEESVKNHAEKLVSLTRSLDIIGTPADNAETSRKNQLKFSLLEGLKTQFEELENSFERYNSLEELHVSRPHFSDGIAKKSEVFIKKVTKLEKKIQKAEIRYYGDAIEKIMDEAMTQAMKELFDNSKPDNQKDQRKVQLANDYLEIIRLANLSASSDEDLEFFAKKRALRKTNLDTIYRNKVESDDENVVNNDDVLPNDDEGQARYKKLYSDNREIKNENGGTILNMRGPLYTVHTNADGSIGSTMNVEEIELSDEDEFLQEFANARRELRKSESSPEQMKSHLDKIIELAEKLQLIQPVATENNSTGEPVGVENLEQESREIFGPENLAQSDLTVPLDLPELEVNLLEVTFPNPHEEPLPAVDKDNILHQEESEVPATASQPSLLDRIEESKNNLKTPPAEPKKISDREQLLAQIRAKTSVLKKVEQNSQLPSDNVSVLERGFESNKKGLDYKRLNADQNGTNGTADDVERDDDAEQQTDVAPPVQRLSTLTNGEQSNSVEKDEREVREMPELKAKEQAEREAREQAERTVREETESKAKRLSTNNNTQAALHELSKKFQKRSPGTNAQNLTEDSLSDSASNAKERMDNIRTKLKALQDKKNRENDVTVVTPKVSTQQRQDIPDVSAPNPESVVSTDVSANPKNGSLNQREASSNINNDRNGANKSKAQKRDNSRPKKPNFNKMLGNLDEKIIYVADLLNRHKEHPDFDSLKKLSRDLNDLKDEIENAKKSIEPKTGTLVNKYKQLNNSYESVTNKFPSPIEQNQKQPESPPVDVIRTSGEQRNLKVSLNDQEFDKSRVVQNQLTSPSVDSSSPLATAINTQPSPALGNVKNFETIRSVQEGINDRIKALRNSEKPVELGNIVQGTPRRVDALIRQFNSANIPGSSVPRTTEGNFQEENGKVNIPGITVNSVGPHIRNIINQLNPGQGSSVPSSGNNSEPDGGANTQTSPSSSGINNTNVQGAEIPTAEALGANGEAELETVNQDSSSSVETQPTPSDSSTPESVPSSTPHPNEIVTEEQSLNNPVTDPLATLTTGDTPLNNTASTQANTARRGGGIPYLVQTFIKDEGQEESGDVFIKEPNENEFNMKHEVETTLDDPNAQGQKIKFTQEITKTESAQPEGLATYRSVFTLNKPALGELTPEQKGKALAQMVVAYMASNKMQPGKKLKLTVYNEADRAIAFQVLEGYFGNNWQDKVSVVDKEDQPVVATASRSSAEARSEVGSNSESLSEVNTFIHKQKERTVYIARKHEFKYSTQNVLADTSASVAEESESRQRSQSKKVRIYNETMPKKCETLLSEDHILYSETLQDRLDDNLKRFKGLKKSNEATNQKLPTSSPSSNSSTPPADDRENRLRQ